MKREQISSSLRITAVLAGLALFCSSLEYLIPKPLPFFRLGLSNIPLLFFLSFGRIRHILLLTFIKVFGQAIIHGTLVSHVFLLSLSGSLSSSFVMIALIPFLRSSTPHISFLGVSIMGALISNVVQMVLALWIVFGFQSWIILFPFCVFGTVGGLIIGIIVTLASSHFQWLKDEYLHS